MANISCITNPFYMEIAQFHHYLNMNSGPYQELWSVITPHVYKVNAIIGKNKNYLE